MQAALRVCRLQELTGLAERVQGHMFAAAAVPAMQQQTESASLQGVDRAFKDRFKATCGISAAVLQLFPAKPKVW